MFCVWLSENIYDGDPGSRSTITREKAQVVAILMKTGLNNALLPTLFTVVNNIEHYYMAFSKFSILIGWQAVRKNPYPDTMVRIFRIWIDVPDVVYLAGNFCFANRKNFCFLNFQLCFTDKNSKQPNCFWLSMHAYCILLPSGTDDSRFNSREKHMLTDSVQPYNKPIIDLACSVCTVKYQTSVFCILKKLGLIFHSTDLTLGQ